MRQCFTLTVLTVHYCELGGCEQGGFVRNMQNAIGYSCFFAGALQAFLFAHASFSEPISGGDVADVYAGNSGVWILMMCALIFTTIHAQDFRDEEGDKARGRETVQTALGDKGARWAVVVAAVGWSVMIPHVLGLGVVVMGLLLSIAGVLSWSMLECLWEGKRTLERDILAHKMWIGWLVAVVMSPLMHNGVELVGNVLSS
jgi:4-hydroxybenzoate polyprenyltransferase